MDRQGQGATQRVEHDTECDVDDDTPSEMSDLASRASNSNEADAGAATDVVAGEVAGDEAGQVDEAGVVDARAAQALRIIEALLFASAEPLDEKTLAERVPDGVDVGPLLEELQAFYRPRGVNLMKFGKAWMFRTAPDLSFLMERERVETRRLSKAAIETLAIIAYHQPVSRAEIEDIRGVAVSKGTLDLLMELDWVKPRGRRRVPGRPLTYGTSQDFLEHFGLESINALPGLDDLKAAGLLEARLPPGFNVPMPTDASEENPDEDLDPVDEEEGDLPEFLDDDGEFVADEATMAAETDADDEAEDGADNWADGGFDGDGTDVADAPDDPDRALD